MTLEIESSRSLSCLDHRSLVFLEFSREPDSLAADLMRAVQIFAGPRTGRFSLRRCVCSRSTRRRRVLGLHPNVESSDSYTRAVQGFDIPPEISRAEHTGRVCTTRSLGDAGRGSLAEERT
ncbi:hypothetical protein VTO73DRAFT_11396 [Trametes versicolor]